VSSNGITSFSNTRFQRGVSYDPTFTSFVIPLSQQTGFRLDDFGNNSENFSGSFPWFTRLQCDTRTHLSLVSSTNTAGVSTNYYNYVTNFNNPIVAFGANAGQSPLYVGQQFQFGVYCGFQYESTNGSGTNFAAPVRILVYNLSSFTNGQTNLIAPIATNYITIPRQTIDTNWWQFTTNGFSVTTNNYGLQTTVKAVVEADGAWGTVPEFTNAQDGAWLITEECTSNMGYGYVLEGLGTVPLSTNLYPMVTNSAGLAWDRLYSLDFVTRPPWLSTLITEPQFNGTPAPSFYQGASLSELTNSDAVLTNSIPLVGSAYTTIDDSPELLDNPTLDQAVANLDDDPIAIANYVLNNIQLTDALSYNPNNGQASAQTVNEGGVNRSAYDVYIEGEGSPVEQCALLVYMLRQAGYPAAYVFPTNNNVQMLDTRLSALLRMQLHGAVNQYGQLYTSNSIVIVNYPWVVTTISNQTVQIFPWLKDTEITEGLDLYNYMPTNYSSGFLWLEHYIYADTNIFDLNPESDEPAVLFPEFVKQELLTNAPGISLDDIGVTAVDRQNYNTSWSDFPTPTVVNNPTQVTIVDSLASPAITNVSPTMTNIFDTVTLTIYSQQNTNEQMTIGPLRMADLHNREMFMATNGTGGMMLWLAPYLASNTNQSAFDGSDPFLTNCQVATLAITTNDTSFDIVMTHNRDLSLNFTPSPDQYLGISDSLVFSTPARPFNLEDIAAICFNVGRVTPAMMDARSYNYASLSRRLTQEQLNLNATTAWTNSFVYDQGTSGGLGVLTAMGQIGQNSGLWNGAPDAFSRVNSETNNSFSYAAYGHANGQAAFSAWLDGNSIPIMGLGTNAMQWRATMDLSRGTHQLEVAAEHPSGFYTAWATNVFTNNVSYEAATNFFDSAGYVTNRVWKSAGGTVYHTQSMSWDAHGRLHQVIDRDANNSGYNWTAVYDPFGRRLSTTTMLVTNGAAYPASSQILNSYFDPEVEFLDLGVQNGNSVTWKLEGPDLDGQYGGLNGVGGLDGTSPSPNLFYPTISDARGDVLGEVINGVVDWSPSRPTGYGAVPGYSPAAFGSGADLAQSSAWRGREVDITGLYNLGARTYDPVSGKFLSFDPLWNAGDPNGYTFCAVGDPINYFDTDGRFGKGFFAAKYEDGYMPASATAAFMKGDYYGSWVRGAGQELGKYIDDGWNGVWLGVAHLSGAPRNPELDQEYLNDMPFTSPMNKWFNVDYGDNSAGNSFVTTFAPLVADTINSMGVGESTTETPTFEVQYEPNFEPVPNFRLLPAPPQQLLLTAPRQPVALLTQKTGSVWNLGWGSRGTEINKLLGENLPRNFPVIDRFDFATGVATSIKSIDLTAKTYQDMKKLTQTLDGYLDSLAAFNGRRWGGVTVNGNQITARQLQLAIPPGSASAAQQAVFNAVAARAQSLGVNFIVTPVP
jgi:RHS repeat-associated protein